MWISVAWMPFAFCAWVHLGVTCCRAGRKHPNVLFLMKGSTWNLLVLRPINMKLIKAELAALGGYSTCVFECQDYKARLLATAAVTQAALGFRQWIFNLAFTFKHKKQQKWHPKRHCVGFFCFLRTSTGLKILLSPAPILRFASRLSHPKLLILNQYLLSACTKGISFYTCARVQKRLEREDKKSLAKD